VQQAVKTRARHRSDGCDQRRLGHDDRRPRPNFPSLERAGISVTAFTCCTAITSAPHSAGEGAQLLQSPLRSVAISPPIKSGERTPLIDHKRTGWMCGAQPSQPQAAFTDGNTATATPPRLLQAHTREPSSSRA
jgi:hypothetical protein